MTAPRKLILALALLFLTAVAPAYGASAWESAERHGGIPIENIDAEQPEISVRDGFVYITASTAVTVKVYTILGQLISQETVPAGTFRLRLPSRGIYILKAGSETKRITI